MVEDGCQHRQTEEAKIKSLTIRNWVHMKLPIWYGLFGMISDMDHIIWSKWYSTISELLEQVKIYWTICSEIEAWNFWTQNQSEKEIIFRLFTFADTDVFFLACEIHLCQDQYCSMPTRSQVCKSTSVDARLWFRRSGRPWPHLTKVHQLFSVIHNLHMAITECSKIYWEVKNYKGHKTQGRDK